MQHISQAKLQEILPAHYVLEKPLSAGSFGHTYLARHKNLPETPHCVIKMLSLHRSENWKVIDLFEREAKILKHLTHDNIPNYIDSFTLQEDQETYFFLVQEYVSGKSLREWVEDGRHFSTDEVLRMGWQAADILTYLHDFHPPIIHRDLKPSNFMLDRQNKLWIIDFGAVRDTLMAQGMQGSTIVGTFGYMPMEQYEGRAQPASDLYALGMTLIFLLTRQEPSHLPKKALRPDFRSRTRLPESVARVIDKLVEVDLNKRYQQASEVRQAFARLRLKKRGVASHLKKLRLDTTAAGAILGVLVGVGLLFLLIFKLGSIPEQSVLTEPEEVLTVMDTVQDNAKPWKRVPGKHDYIIRSVITEANGVWLSSYGTLYYQSLEAQGAIYKWSSEQIMQSDSIRGLRQHKNTVYVLGEHKNNKQMLAYTQGPESQWLRIALPPSPEEAGAFVVDTAGNIWISQDKTVWTYDMQAHRWNKRYTLDHKVSALHQDKQGRLWLGTLRELYKVEAGAPKKQAELQKGYIKDLTMGAETLGIISSEGFYRFQPEQRTVTRHLPKHDITAIMPLDNDWVVTTKSQGMHRISASGTKTWSYAEGLPEDHISTISHNERYVITVLDQEELLFLPVDTFKRAFDEVRSPEAIKPLQSFKTGCDVQNSQGDVFVSRAAKRERVFFKNRSICPYGDTFRQGNTLFFIKDNTLFKQVGAKLTPIPMPVKTYLLPESLLFDPQGRIWLSISLKGNFVYDKKWKRLKPESPLHFIWHQNKMYAMNRDGNVYSYDQRLESLNAPADLRFTSVYDMESVNDRLVFATSRGLMMYHPESGQWSELVKGFTQRLAHDKDGIWFTRLKKGLGYYDFKTRETFFWSSREGLPTNYLTALAMGKPGQLWIEDGYERVHVYRATDLRDNHAKIQKKNTRTGS